MSERREKLGGVAKDVVEDMVEGRLAGERRRWSTVVRRTGA
jgi:hypothetical protein